MEEIVLLSSHDQCHYRCCCISNQGATLDTPNRPQQCQARDLGAASVVVECLDLNILNTLGHVFVLELYQVRLLRLLR